MNQIKKIKKNNIMYALILYFPMIYIWFAILSNNNYMRIFYFIYSAIIILLRLFNAKSKNVGASDIVILMILVTYTIMSIIMFPDVESRSSGILFFFMYFYMFMYGDKELRNDYSNYIIDNKNKYFVAIIVYYVAVLTTIISGIGISDGWGTTSLQGPYGLAHIFAYELLLLGINSYLIYMGTKEKRWLIVSAFNICLMILTSVRTTLLCLVCIVIYYFIVKRNYKKKYILILAIAAVLLMYKYTPLFQTIIEKTKNAAETGDITNARFVIWSNSYNYFKESTLFNKLFGNGMQNLMNYNYNHIRMAIHAHNEFIDILAAYGIFSFLQFLYCFKKILKGKNSLGFFIGFLILAWFNGVYSDCSFVIGLISLRVLFEKINYEMKSTI